MTNQPTNQQTNNTTEPQEGVVYRNVEWIKTETGWRMIQNKPQNYKNTLTQLYDDELVEVWHYEDAEGCQHDLLKPERCLKIKFDNQVKDEYNKKFLNLVKETEEIIKKHINHKTFLIRDTLHKNLSVIEQKITYSAIRNELQEDTNLGSKIGRSVSKYNEFLCMINKIVIPLKKDKKYIYKLIENQQNYKPVKLIKTPEPEPENICSICQEDIMKTSQWIIKCLTCKNSLFHFNKSNNELNCINKWWVINKTCPACRSKHIIKDKDYKFIHKDNMNKIKPKIINLFDKLNDDFIDED